MVTVLALVFADKAESQTEKSVLGIATSQKYLNEIIPNSILINSYPQPTFTKTLTK